jgi:hypothetical protein
LVSLFLVIIWPFHVLFLSLVRASSCPRLNNISSDNVVANSKAKIYNYERKSTPSDMESHERFWLLHLVIRQQVKTADGCRLSRSRSCKLQPNAWPYSHCHLLLQEPLHYWH